MEKFLEEAPNTASYDAVRQSVVILMGTLAKHLEKDDPKVKPIVGKLIETLSTPSQQVSHTLPTNERALLLWTMKEESKNKRLLTKILL